MSFVEFLCKCESMGELCEKSCYSRELGLLEKRNACLSVFWTSIIT